MTSTKLLLLITATVVGFLLLLACSISFGESFVESVTQHG